MSHEVVQLKEEVSLSPYYSEDMAPTRQSDRNWGTKDFNLCD